MVKRQIFKCITCESRIMLRTQASHLKEHPINIYCGNCSTLISGKVVFNPENATIDIELDNVIPSNEEYPLYEIEISAEFMTNKLVKRNSPEEVQLLSPYIKTVSSLGTDKILEIGKKISQFLYLKNNDWKDLKRINELWLNGKSEYLEKELSKYLSKKQFPLNNDLEYLRGIHHLNLLFFLNILKKDYFEEIAFFLHSEINNIVKTHRDNFFDMVKFFSDKGLLIDYEKRIFEITNNFVSKFEQVIPAIVLEYYSNANLEQMGITTASFEDLKHFYIDTYESISVIVDLLEALNNIKHRSNYNSARDIRKDVETLSKFQELNKGVKLNEFINGKETFDTLIFPKADNQIRNAIGHKSYTFDGLRQLITYYPKGKIGDDYKKQIYLIEFAKKCIQLMQCTLNLGELVYQIRKIDFLQKGCCISVLPDVFSFKSTSCGRVGRNEMCPCGSGNKFKKCCG